MYWNCPGKLKQLQFTRLLGPVRMIAGNLEGMQYTIFFNIAVAGVGKFIYLPCV